ncbi:MAG: ribonuclease HII [Sphingomonadaceae bacterium]|nr:ribonuclease HII [Sphingomonadaceae bacterium]
MDRVLFPGDEKLVVGVDEAGRGPLAGPVVAGAVLLLGDPLPGLDDSKKLSAKRRGVLENEIKARCLWAVGFADVEEIDRINILAATMLAMTRAVSALCEVLARDADEVLIDGNLTPAGRCDDWRWNGRAIVGGDGCEPCISAASIIAKEHRDRVMRELALSHPEYGWERNAGYGTKQHMEALRQHGPTVHHRRSFAPVAQCEIQL